MKMGNYEEKEIMKKEKKMEFGKNIMKLVFYNMKLNIKMVTKKASGKNILKMEKWRVKGIMKKEKKMEFGKKII